MEPISPSKVKELENTEAPMFIPKRASCHKRRMDSITEVSLAKLIMHT
jgi:hypothetical protein